jgi:hypothetical protein
MKTIYLAVYGKNYAVQMTRIVKETKCFVYVTNWQGREFRHAKVTQDARYFETEIQAWQWLKDKARAEHNTAQRRADEKLFVFNQITEQLKKLI